MELLMPDMCLTKQKPAVENDKTDSLNIKQRMRMRTAAELRIRQKMGDQRLLEECLKSNYYFLVLFLTRDVRWLISVDTKPDLEII